MDQRTVELAITGMTCASCVARVEKKLGKIPGVHATVNLATESARVQVPAEVSDEDVINQVVRAGYGAELVLPEPEHPSAGGGEVEADTELPADTRAASLRRRFLICAALSLPVMALSMVPAWQFTGWQWVVAALALPVAGWGAWPFHRAAAQAARHGSSTMDTLVSLGVLAATGWSVWALLWGGAGKLGMTMDMTLLPRLSGSGGHAGHHSVPELYFESAAMVTTFLLAGRWAETRARHRAGAALRDLLELGAKEATRVRERGGVVVEESIPAAQVRPGDLLRIRPGEKMPADGAVVEGASAVDTSMITGEMEPVEVGAGDPVTAGTIALTGSVLMRAERVGADTVVAQIGRMVTQAQAEKAPIQRLADRISAVFVPIVVALAGATFIGWWLLDGRLMAAFTAAVAVLVIACPCALGLATPTALLVGSGRAAKLGVLIKSPQILEAARSIDTIIWDKTGTLTSGQVQVTGVLPHAPGVTEAEVLRLAAAVEQLSEHPLARAIVAATGNGETLPTASEFVTSAGLGVSATVAGQRVVVGKADYLAAARIEVPGASGAAGSQVPADATVVWVARAGTCLGAI
ncbi:MAG: heavy metal translocating P-type ATPase, partial [Bowdeniella nasicola]|nr:heavy metal translocating P-type ATPase [Bowdeniella nasicola]